MTKRQVFYSFHYDGDVRRVQQIRNIGALDGNQPASPNTWETIKRSGDYAIKKWIDDNMHNKSCVIVLIGEQTASRRWVKYEIEKAWNEGKAVLGIYIHNIKDPLYGTCRQGMNPFTSFNIGRISLSEIVPCKNPNPYDAYNDIRYNIDKWIEEAIAIRARYK